MKYGFILPFGDARAVSIYAKEAEQAGWDGIFLGEAIWHNDIWISLTAAAMTTHTIRLGSMISPLPRMRPWKLAAETATLDNLSQGRVILSVGMGVYYYGYQCFHDENLDLKTRAELMDEGIDLLTLLHRGEPFTFNGKHYHVDLTQMDRQYFAARPVQQPRVPIWVVSIWPRMKSVRRALRCDGILLNKKNENGQEERIQPRDVADVRAFIDANRTSSGPFDIISEGNTLEMSPQQTMDHYGLWESAGATWWIETLYGQPEEKVLERLRQGPEKH